MLFVLFALFDVEISRNYPRITVVISDKRQKQAKVREVREVRGKI